MGLTLLQHAYMNEVHRVLTAKNVLCRYHAGASRDFGN